ncbi:MAG: L,D-transpeptidase [Pyrinomonadaceae bacterium]
MTIKIKRQLAGLTLSLLCLLGFIACEAPPQQQPSVTTANANAAVPATAANTNSIAPTPAAAPSAANEDLAITFPVLDAFFADDSFASELKSKLQMSDEQVTKLRAMARAETAKLREGEAEERGGSTGAAHALYAEKSAAELGQDKARQLSELIRTRWSEGNAVLSGDKPNAVPTDTRIVVNAPAYRMDVFDNGRLVKSYKIGIGYPEFPLPSGMRQATSIIFNPTWTPPDEPWVESSNEVKVGQKVEAGSKLNPLGVIKIPIGMPSLIHGGKLPARLGGFASHGCVGLTDKQVQEFSQLLGQLGGAQISPEDVAQYEGNRTETKNLKLEKPVPVDLRYETIVAEDGRLHIYRDVYDRGTNTEENLRSVFEAQGLSLDELAEGEKTRIMNALQKMARGATGKLVEPNQTPTPAANNNARQNANESDKVTRNIKGEKEIILEIAALKGKGYPAPVDLNTGGAPAAQRKAVAKR